MKQQNLDLTTGSIPKTLLRFAVPFVLSFLLQSAYSIVDLLVIGRFGGTYSLAGVNMGTQIMDLVVSIAIGLLIGSTVLISQSVGAKKMENVEKIIGTVSVFVLGLAVILTIVMFILSKQVMAWMQTPAESYSESYNYYRIVVLGTIFIFGFNIVSSILNGLGDSRSSLLFVAIATGVNVILDVSFVAGLKMGAAGAALATIISQCISFISGAVFLFRRSKRYGITLHFSGFRIRKDVLKQFLKIGLPSAFQEAILTFSLTIVIAVANMLGVYSAAAVGVCGKINVIFILPIIAINAAINVMVGQNVGAQRLDRAVKTAWSGFFISLPYAFAVCALFYFGGSLLLSLFTDDPQTIAIGASYLKWHCWDYCLVMPAAYAVGGLFSGTGHTGIIALSNLISSVIFRIPLAYGLAIVAGFGADGIGMAFPISTCIVMLVYVIPLMKKTWAKPVNQLIGENG